VVKLFSDEHDYNDEKDCYDKTLEDPSLRHLANQYTEIDIKLDTDIGDYRGTPFKKALLHPYLKNPDWIEVGKLCIPCNDRLLTDNGLDVERVKNDFDRIGLASWEATIFMRSNPLEFKAIDLTSNKGEEIGSIQ